MSVISLKFLFFLLAALIVYYLLPAKLQWIWLLITSLGFYYINATPLQFLFFIIYVVVNWAASRFLSNENAYRKQVFRGTLIFDVLVLVLFKYSGFFYGIYCNIGHVLGLNLSSQGAELTISQIELLAPARISYFALIIIGYLTDVYWGKYEGQKNVGKLILFTGYFPQMTSGPIVKYDTMMQQLASETKKKFNYEKFASGSIRILWGIFKKLVISERCAIVVSTVYSYYDVYSGLYIVLAAAMFAMQLYTDFSGLMDIVLGASEVLGIELPENFDTPFYSTSLSEFWRRWHITLGGFLREYVFYPVQRSEAFRKLRKWCKKTFGKDYESKCNLPVYLGLFASWFLIGLWHGGGWNYIFGVGLYMWLIIVSGELFTPLFKRLILLFKINTECFSWRLFQRVRTFFIFIFGLSFFRAASLREGFHMWKAAFSSFNPWIFFDESIYTLGLEKEEFQICLIGLLIVLIVSMIQQKGQVRTLLMKQNFVFRLIIITLLVVSIVIYGCYGSEYHAADFIYGRF
ncbi:MAG: MBOAT family protein [Clostridia bacterium]|nr:MBOAT family protein [Clostridia bacterium]